MDNIHSIARFAGRKVLVYWNLHKNMYSVMDAVTRRVITHTRNIRLNNVTFKVSEAGRQRVLREGRKNVHAFVCGEVDGADFPGQFTAGIRGTVVTYNPHKAAYFTNRDDGARVSGADYMMLGIAVSRSLMQALGVR
jgi:hypothetical protein